MAFESEADSSQASVAANDDNDKDGSQFESLELTQEQVFSVFNLQITSTRAKAKFLVSLLTLAQHVSTLPEHSFVAPAEVLAHPCVPEVVSSREKRSDDALVLGLTAEARECSLYQKGHCASLCEQGAEGSSHTQIASGCCSSTLIKHVGFQSIDSVVVACANAPVEAMTGMPQIAKSPQQVGLQELLTMALASEADGLTASVAANHDNDKDGSQVEAQELVQEQVVSVFNLQLTSTRAKAKVLVSLLTLAQHVS
eukprot:CAMPEP_0177368686 /NCGR_PEP_ID=MMETSP0368-20130122/41059_1 /TAXON_ID=447022 ORGANISM="Scrippsiella hangoei-like, Strain SHHI-4" /NCGR_SAMPLE_ID=MMETSP0368 /ASSEMBLY_ACC=CAM_ASM_000363 /LENGTH=254 /DNA_ID=CAMNT_0018831837 /DNA_START=127 /DNA_END=890 /DNA_ORIENTATION=+